MNFALSVLKDLPKLLTLYLACFRDFFFISFVLAASAVSRDGSNTLSALKLKQCHSKCNLCYLRQPLKIPSFEEFLLGAASVVAQH